VRLINYIFSIAHTNKKDKEKIAKGDNFF